MQNITSTLMHMKYILLESMVKIKCVLFSYHANDLLLLCETEKKNKKKTKKTHTMSTAMLEGFLTQPQPKTIGLTLHNEELSHHELSRGAATAVNIKTTTTTTSADKKDNVFSEETCEEFKYWKKGGEKKWSSPWKRSEDGGGNGQQQYITFEADHGGWNNGKRVKEEGAWCQVCVYLDL
jgi:hypothetical protein